MHLSNVNYFNFIHMTDEQILASEKDPSNVAVAQHRKYIQSKKDALEKLELMKIEADKVKT